MKARVDPAAVDRLLGRAAADVESGALPACQLALALDGELVAFEAFGEATTATRFTVFSTTKVFVASVVWQLLGEGLLELPQRVAEVIPEFGENGKGAITLEQVLLHTSGFPVGVMDFDAWRSPAARRATFATWRLSWEPGTRFEYHSLSAHYVLAELIRAVTGDDHRDAVDRRVREPLGLPRRVLGIQGGDDEDILPSYEVGDAPDPVPLPEGVTAVVDTGELLKFNRADVRELGVPGAGGVMTAADLALFYQGLLHNPGELWGPAVLADGTANVRNTFLDPWTGVPANRTIGVVVAGDDGHSALRWMGSSVSPRAFGHAGAGGQIAWADPVTGLSFGYCTNGMERDPAKLAERECALSTLAAAAVSVR